MNFKSFVYEMYTYLLFRTSQPNFDSHHKCSNLESARRNSGFIHACAFTAKVLRVQFESHNKHRLFPPTALMERTT